VETGKYSDRPQLDEALAAARRRRATLVIAKLDRLARNVHFISGLLETGVDFVGADCPNDDRSILHIRAAIAEDEARKISQRTKAACKQPRREASGWAVITADRLPATPRAIDICDDGSDLGSKRAGPGAPDLLRGLPTWGRSAIRLSMDTSGHRARREQELPLFEDVVVRRRLARAASRTPGFLEDVTIRRNPGRAAVKPPGSAARRHADGLLILNS
jgi:hypothetical protein